MKPCPPRRGVVRILPALLIAAAIASSGCLSDDPESLAPVDLAPECPMVGDVTLYFGPDHSLTPVLPEAGRVSGNGFDEAFLVNAMNEWTSVAVEQNVHIMGNLTLHYWSEGHNMVAPVVIGGAPGEGYHWFNQVGSNRGFVESYAIEYASVIDAPEVREWTQTYAMPSGGLYLEPGDNLRILLTNLVLNHPTSGAGPDILFGGDTPSSVSFQAHCRPAFTWDEGSPDSYGISIPAHHGLLTGAVPAQDGLNHVDAPFTLAPETARLTISIEEGSAVNPTKNDIDLSVLNPAGEEVWSIGSPYTDEVGTKWPVDLAMDMPPGDYTIRVNSYSGIAYEGTLTIQQDRLSEAPGSPDS